MPIIVHYNNERMQPDVVEGDSWKKLDSDSPRLGTINLKSLADGHRIIIVKSSIAKVEEISQQIWDEGIAAQKKAQEEQREAQKTQQKAAARAATQGKIDAWHKQPWFKKVGRHCPWTLPADIAAASPKA
jgi:diadenosine tetraphosphate (Ap4A) HIT family hydrolase